MIESFTIKNYMCYREETEFSFVASKKEGKKIAYLPRGIKKSVVNASFGYLYVLESMVPVNQSYSQLLNI